MRQIIWFCTLGLLVFLSGCASTRPARDVQPSGFLGKDADLLKRGSSDDSPLIYRNPDVNWSQYTNVLLDPITFWRSPGGDTQKISTRDKQMLIDYFYQLIHKEFSKDFNMVRIPEPNTLRVKVAITKAEQSYVALDLVSTVIPQLHVLSGLKTLVTGKPAFVGEAAIAFKVNDATTGTLLAEGVADRVGGKTLNSEHLQSWGDVEEALQFWVQHTGYKLCELQQRADCVQPEKSLL